MFRFANPQYLWLLLAVPALVALYWLAARNRRRRLARFGRPGILEELMPEVSTGRTAFRFILSAPPSRWSYWLRRARSSVRNSARRKPRASK